MTTVKENILDAVILITIACFCFFYIFQKTEYIMQKDTLHAKEVEWMKLKKDNDAYEDSIRARIRVQEIHDKAVHTWGFQYPKEEALREYSVQDMYYVVQKMPLENSEQGAD